VSPRSRAGRPALDAESAQKRGMIRLPARVLYGASFTSFPVKEDWDFLKV
jgi:hypothetical protein